MTLYIHTYPITYIHFWLFSLHAYKKMHTIFPYGMCNSIPWKKAGETYWYLALNLPSHFSADFSISLSSLLVRW